MVCVHHLRSHSVSSKEILHQSWGLRSDVTLLQTREEAAVGTGSRKRCGKGGRGFPRPWPQLQWPWAERRPNEAPEDTVAEFFIACGQTECLLNGILSMLIHMQNRGTITQPTTPLGAWSHGTIVLRSWVLKGLQPGHSQSSHFIFHAAVLFIFYPDSQVF